MNKNIKNFFKKIKVLNNLKDGDIVCVNYDDNFYIFKSIDIHHDGFFISLYAHNYNFNITSELICLNNYRSIRTEDEYINEKDVIEDKIIDLREERKKRIKDFKELCKNKYKELQKKYDEHIKELEFINNI